MLPSPLSWFTLKRKDSSFSASVYASASVVSVEEGEGIVVTRPHFTIFEIMQSDYLLLITSAANFGMQQRCQENGKFSYTIFLVFICLCKIYTDPYSALKSAFSANQISKCMQMKFMSYNYIPSK